MKTRSTSRSAFVSRSALIALPVLAGVLLALFSVSSPPVAGLLRRRLDDHKANPAGGVSWEELRDPLLKRRHA
jgi:hypothetical protein